MKLSLRQILDSPIIIAVALLLLVLIVNKNLEHPLVVDEAKKELMRMTFGVEALTDDFLESIATRQDGRDFEPLNGYPSSDSPERRAFFKKYSPADRGMVRSSQVGRPLMVHGLSRQNNCLAAPYNRDSRERPAIRKVTRPIEEVPLATTLFREVGVPGRGFESHPFPDGLMVGVRIRRRVGFLPARRSHVNKMSAYGLANTTGKDELLTSGNRPEGLQPWAVEGGHAQAVAAISEKIPIIVVQTSLYYNGTILSEKVQTDNTGRHGVEVPSSSTFRRRLVCSDRPSFPTNFLMQTRNERTQTEGQVPGGADVATSPETFYNLIQELVHDHGGPDQLRHDLWQLYIVAAGNDDQPWSPRDHADYALLVYQLCEVLTKEGGAV